MKLDKPIPFLDLATPHLELQQELMEVFQTTLQTAAFVGGPMVEQFETDFASFCGTKYCIGVASGTDALRFALLAAGIEPGDLVLTVPNTFIATTEAITQAGAVPDFIDIDERTYTMDPEKLREYIDTLCYPDDANGKLIHRPSGKAVTAVIPVHLYGQTADMDPIAKLAEKNNLIVIEDACQAHGAEYFTGSKGAWRRAGTMGVAAAFSFYPGKNLGACGEAGAVTTDHEQIAARVRLLRDHGQARKYLHEIEGYNGRLDAVQAGILSVKLKHLPRWNRQRQECAARYNELLAPFEELVTPFAPAWSRSVYHLYVVCAQSRDRLQSHLSEHGIAVGLHYPIPLHRQKAYADTDMAKRRFPVAEKMASQLLSLPIYPHLTDSSRNRIAGAIAAFYGNKR